MKDCEITSHADVRMCTFNQLLTVCTRVFVGTSRPGCRCVRPIVILLNPLGPQQAITVCSLVIDELNSKALHPEEPPSKSTFPSIFGNA